MKSLWQGRCLGFVSEWNYAFLSPERAQGDPLRPRDVRAGHRHVLAEWERKELRLRGIRMVADVNSPLWRHTAYNARFARLARITWNSLMVCMWPADYGR